MRRGWFWQTCHLLLDFLCLFEPNVQGTRLHQTLGPSGLSPFRDLAPPPIHRGQSWQQLPPRPLLLLPLPSPLEGLYSLGLPHLFLLLKLLIRASKAYLLKHTGWRVWGGQAATRCWPGPCHRARTVAPSNWERLVQLLDVSSQLGQG